MAQPGRTSKTVDECKQAWREARNKGGFPVSCQLMVTSDGRCTVVDLEGANGLEPVKGLDNLSGNSFCDSMGVFLELMKLQTLINGSLPRSE